MQHPVESQKPTRFPLPNVTIPYIYSSPIFDIGLLLALFPLWWFLGVEQFIWTLGTFLIMLKVVAKQRQKVYVVATLKWLFFFLIVHLLSGFFIVESFRLITFVRNFGAYSAAFLVVLIITNQLKSWREVRWLLVIMTGILFLSASVSLLGILGIWRPSFTSLMGSVLPGWIRATSYGGQIAVRSLGRPSWFSGLNSYFRVNGFFMFSTMYASTLAYFLPMVFFLFSMAAKLRGKMFLALVIVLFIINLIFTTGRIAIISCLIGAAFYLVFYAGSRILVRLLALFAIVCVILILFFSAYYTSDVFEPIAQLYEDLVYARGPGSFTDRGTVYVHTIEGALQRPLLGWGTERDIPNFPYPAGSHSHYLAILYKQGIVGLLVFLGMLITLWKETTIPHLKQVAHPDQVKLLKFLKYGRWTLVTVLVNSFTDVLDLDATTMMMMWTILAMLIQARRMITSAQYLEQPAHAAN